MDPATIFRVITNSTLLGKWCLSSNIRREVCNTTSLGKWWLSSNIRSDISNTTSLGKWWLSNNIRSDVSNTTSLGKWCLSSNIHSRALHIIHMNNQICVSYIGLTGVTSALVENIWVESEMVWNFLHSQKKYIFWLDYCVLYIVYIIVVKRWKNNYQLS